jgi:hypothetical protein
MAFAESALADPDAQASARPLFEEGRRLMKAGAYTEACPKLEAAAKLYPGPGILLNLGDCHQRLGKTASAWAEFGDAAAGWERAGRSEFAAEARRRQTDLEPTLSRLQVRLGAAAVGVSVTYDGLPWSSERLGKPVPVDPGAHTIAAQATGRASWSTVVEMGRPGQLVVVDIPELEGSSPPPAAPEAARPTPTPKWSTQAVIGVVAAGAGAATLIVGGALALSAKSKFDAARDETGDARHADSQSAFDRGNLATVVGLVGAGVLVAGGILWLTAPRARAAVGTSGTNVVVQGSF